MFCVEELCQFGMRGKIGVLKRLHLVLKVGMCIEMRREILKLVENILFSIYVIVMSLVDERSYCRCFWCCFWKFRVMIRVQGVLFSVLEEEVGMCIERYKRKQEVKVDVIFTFVMIAIMQVGETSLCQLVKKTPVNLD